MLRNENIHQWYNQMLYSGSEITAIAYVRRLSTILERIGLTPQSILSVNKENLFQRMLKFGQDEKNRGKAPSYIVSQFKPLYSYLKFKDVDFKRVPRPKNAHSTPTLKNETIPTKEQLNKVIQSSTLREKVSISLMAFSGLRPGVLGNFNGNIGLTIGDIEGLQICDDGVIVNPPLLIHIREELSKSSYSYFTFLCSEGAQYLKNYIDVRIEKGEKISMSSPVIRSNFKDRDFIKSKSIRAGIRGSFTRIGFPNRPYVLRRYFASMLLRGETNGDIPHSYSQFMMGHSGEMMDRYTLQKGLLDEQIDSLRQSYTRCQQYLQTDVLQEDLEATNKQLERMEIKNDTLEEMLIEKINEQNQKQELLNKKITDLEKENIKLIEQKKSSSIEIGELATEIFKLSKAIVTLKNKVDLKLNNAILEDYAIDSSILENIDRFAKSE